MSNNGNHTSSVRNENCQMRAPCISMSCMQCRVLTGRQLHPVQWLWGLDAHSLHVTWSGRSISKLSHPRLRHASISWSSWSAQVPAEMTCCASTTQLYGRCWNTRVRRGTPASLQLSRDHWSRYSGGPWKSTLWIMTMIWHYGNICSTRYTWVAARSADWAVLPAQCVVWSILLALPAAGRTRPLIDRSLAPCKDLRTYPSQN